MKTKTWAIWTMVTCTLFISAAQLLLKIGADNIELDIISLITNYPLMAGFTLYAVGAVLVVIALRGGEVTVLFPIITSSYIWVTLLSRFVLEESISIYRWTGIIVIFIGILFIGIAGNKESAVSYESVVQ